MNYTSLKLIINEAYANFTANYISRKRFGVIDKYSLKRIFFVKCIYKVLMNQEGDETKDYLTKLEIQDIIRLFNKYSNSTVQIEYV
jgi:hypothetical protein